MLNWLTPNSLLRLISYNTQYHSPRSGTAHKVLGTLTSITNEENAPTGLPTGQSCGNIFPIEVLRLWVTDTNLVTRRWWKRVEVYVLRLKEIWFKITMTVAAEKAQ